MDATAEEILVQGGDSIAATRPWAGLLSAIRVFGQVMTDSGGAGTASASGRTKIRGHDRSRLAGSEQALIY
jgi:hypothetical protein